MWHQENTTRWNPPPMLTFCSSMARQRYEVLIEAIVTRRQAVNAWVLSVIVQFSIPRKMLRRSHPSLAWSVFIFLEHGRYVKIWPWRSPAVQAGTHCPSNSWNRLQLCTLAWCNRCSQNFQYQMDWLVASDLIHGYSFDWNSHILAG